MTREPGDRPTRVALAGLKDWSGAERFLSERHEAAGAVSTCANGRGMPPAFAERPRICVEVPPHRAQHAETEDS
ncbi:hypothetical protein DFR46_2015 [Parasphingopyxis lamellibrachiae]|uniref:Uncharacterized protein n=1 Tax=Parasphingopyxis lamellibrachiae TaxID=680125 RepID=A0A3D9FIP9_9SPHN|nr:hypothetical protein DFR46_2015 [Parasphingopyxis lamellibrachiae]